MTKQCDLHKDEEYFANNMTKLTLACELLPARHATVARFGLRTQYWTKMPILTKLLDE